MILKKNSVDILITGGSGMLGSQFNFGIKPSRKEFDIMSKKKINQVFRKYKPNMVIHLAAMTDKKKCEFDPVRAYDINAVGTYNIAQACRAYKSKMIYISTAFVFDGKKKSPYKENAIPNPISVYGKTKYMGECITQDIVPRFLIIRSSLLFGGGEHRDIRLVGNTIKQLRSGGKRPFMEDSYCSPTYIKDFIKALGGVYNKKGVIHITNTGMPSYYDIALEIKKIQEFKTPVISGHMEKLDPERNKNTALVSHVLSLRSWRLALKQYINDEWKNTKR